MGSLTEFGGTLIFSNVEKEKFPFRFIGSHLANVEIFKFVESAIEKCAFGKTGKQ